MGRLAGTITEFNPTHGCGAVLAEDHHVYRFRDNSGFSESQKIYFTLRDWFETYDGRVIKKATEIERA